MTFLLKVNDRRHLYVQLSVTNDCCFPAGELDYSPIYDELVIFSPMISQNDVIINITSDIFYESVEDFNVSVILVSEPYEGLFLPPDITISILDDDGNTDRLLCLVVG